MITARFSRRSSLCISTKSLPLDGSGYPSDGSTSCTTDSPHTSSHAPSNQNTPNDPALRVRSESFPMSDSVVDGVSGRLLTDKQHSSHESGLDVAGLTVRHDLDHSAGSGPHAHTVSPSESRRLSTFLLSPAQGSNFSSGPARPVSLPPSQWASLLV